MIAGSELDIGLKLLPRRVGTKTQVAHADERVFRTEIVKEIHELRFLTLDTDSLADLEEKLVGLGLLTAALVDADLAAGGLVLDRGGEMSLLFFGGDG